MKNNVFACIAKKSILIIFFVSLLMFFQACVGIDARIDIAANGSSIVNVEYRVSKMVQAMGRLNDDSEGQLPLPVGREDVQRSIENMPGSRLISFSSKEDEEDTLYSMRLGFDSLQALANYLSANGQRAHVQKNSDTQSLSIQIAQDSPPLDGELLNLIENVFQDYIIRLQIHTPTPLSSTGAEVHMSDSRTAVFTSPVASLMQKTRAETWLITW